MHLAVHEMADVGEVVGGVLPALGSEFAVMECFGAVRVCAELAEAV
jgi:hypothetical protein